MDELEIFKKGWNNEFDEFKNYSEKEIYSMIKRKSISVTKNLVFIGLIEIALWSIYGFIDGKLPVFRMVILVLFFTMIIYFYFRIKAHKNSVSLMRAILNTRKVIFWYAAVSLVLIVSDNIFHFDHYTKDFMAGLHDGYNNNDLHSTNPQQMTPSPANYVIFAFLLLVFLYFLYMIYNKTYGKILFNLRRNYSELNKIENDSIQTK